MPGTIFERDELNHFASALDQAMRRYPQIGDVGKILMRLRIEPVTKKLLDIATAILPRRQADGMHHDQLDVSIRRTLFEIGRRHFLGLIQPALINGQ